MPDTRTSRPAARRRAAWIEHREPASPELSAKRRAAALARWAKEKGRSIEEQERISAERRAASGATTQEEAPTAHRANGEQHQDDPPRAPTAGTAAATLDGLYDPAADASHVHQMMQAQMQDLSGKQAAVRHTLAAAAIENAPVALAYLLRLTKGEGDAKGAPHVVRRQAANDIMNLAGVGIESGGALPIEKPINEWSKAELDALVRALAEQIACASRRAAAVDADVVNPDDQDGGGPALN